MVNGLFGFVGSPDERDCYSMIILQYSNTLDVWWSLQAFLDGYQPVNGQTQQSPCLTNVPDGGYFDIS